MALELGANPVPFAQSVAETEAQGQVNFYLPANPAAAVNRLGRPTRGSADGEHGASAPFWSDPCLRRLVEATAATPWEADPETGRFTYVGPQVAQILGHPVGDWYEEDFWIAHLHPDDRERAADVRRRAGQQSEGIDLEYRMVAADGRTVWLRDLAVGVVKNVRPAQLRGFLIDISEPRRAEQELRQAHAEIEKLKDQLHQQNASPRHKINLLHGQEQVIGQTQAVKQVLAQVEQVALTDATVLVLGETGTGKEMLASAIHQQSSRRDRTMVKVNCSALPATLVESELFGREKGAYTGALARQVGRFELAHGSTIFLDEVGELPAEVQVKLLRVLQEGNLERLGSPRSIQVDVRVIAATNRDLAQAVRAGRFREDLYYRLNVFPITVPPLRERREDIPLLVWAFVEEFGRKMGKSVRAIARGSMEALQRYPWPGNVRELRNIIERALITSTTPTLRIAPPEAANAVAAKSMALADAEREHILRVLELTHWRIRGPEGAAALLQIKPTTLESRMAKLGLQRPALISDIS
jgi:PAS domain S-box-containing protein